MELARALSLGKPFREPRQVPASSVDWRPWLDAALASAAKISSLAQLIASVTADNLQFSWRVFLHQNFFVPAWRSHTPQSSHERLPSVLTGGCSAVIVALHWLRVGGRSFFSDGLPASLRHSDHTWKACRKAGSAASRLDPAPDGIKDAAATDIPNGLVSGRSQSDAGKSAMDDAFLFP